MSLLKLENISQVFGFGSVATTALKAVDLEVKKGDFVALMGPSGSGKTTLLNIIGLLTKPSRGVYTLFGQDATQMSQARQAKLRQKRIGFIFQNFNLLPDLTILDNVSLPLLYSSRLTFFRRVKTVKKHLNRLGVHQKEFLYPFQLSGGQIQRVAIARALVSQPSLIIADEPTGSLDSVNSEVIMNILANIHQEGGTILMATHNPLLTKYANRIIYIHDGEIRIDQKLESDQQVDLGKMQDAVNRQNFKKRRSNSRQDKPKTEAKKPK